MNNRKTWRDRLCWWVLDRSPTPEGQVPPWWLLALWWTLHPVDAVKCWAAGVYDPWRDEYRLHGFRFSGRVIRDLACGALPSRWYRVVRRADGVITVESWRPEQGEGR